jgi:hypothetical protein
MQLRFDSLRDRVGFHRWREQGRAIETEKIDRQLVETFVMLGRSGRLREQ